MEHITFCKSIGLPSAALDVIRCVSVDEAEFFTLKNLFFRIFQDKIFCFFISFK